MTTSNKIPICSGCSGSVTLEPDTNGNKNVWFVCSNCDLSFPTYMNEGFNLSKISGYEPTKFFTLDNPSCICDHTFKYHKENGKCMACDCIEFRPV